MINTFLTRLKISVHILYMCTCVYIILSTLFTIALEVSASPFRQKKSHSETISIC